MKHWMSRVRNTFLRECVPKSGPFGTVHSHEPGQLVLG